MTDWADKFAGADAIIDEELGDEVEFASDGNTFTPLKCFVFPKGAEADISFASVDPMDGVPRLKVAKARIAKPSKSHRFKVPQLEDPEVTKWSPGNWVAIEHGRYWLIDLQKAVT